MTHSPASMMLLERMFGSLRGSERRGRLPTYGMPVAIKVSDPREDIEEVVDALFDGPARRPATSWMKHLTTAGIRPGPHRGPPEIDGRPCCMLMLRSLDSQLGNLRLPSEHVCPECGTTWRLEHRVTEERPHG